METIGYDSGRIAASKIINNFAELQNNSLSVANNVRSILGTLGHSIITINYETLENGNIHIISLAVCADKIHTLSNIELGPVDILYLGNAGFNLFGGTPICHVDNGELVLDVDYCMPLTFIEQSDEVDLLEEGFYTITHDYLFLGKGYISLNVSAGEVELVAGRETPSSFVVKALVVPANFTWVRNGVGWINT